MKDYNETFEYQYLTLACDSTVVREDLVEVIRTRTNPEVVAFRCPKCDAIHYSRRKG